MTMAHYLSCRVFPNLNNRYPNAVIEARLVLGCHPEPVGWAVRLSLSKPGSLSLSKGCRRIHRARLGSMCPKGSGYSFRGTNKKRIFPSPLIDLTMKNLSMKKSVLGEIIRSFFLFFWKRMPASPLLPCTPATVSCSLISVFYSRLFKIFVCFA